MKQEVFARISLNDEEIRVLDAAYDILERVAETAAQMEISVDNVYDACNALTEVLCEDECVWVKHENSGE